MEAMKRVTQKEYAEKLNENKHREYTLQLRGWQVPILHGLITLAAAHPGVKGLNVYTHQTIREVREWCKTVFAGWGFTREEVEFLDKIREQENKADEKGG